MKYFVVHTKSPCRFRIPQDTPECACEGFREQIFPCFTPSFRSHRRSTSVSWLRRHLAVRTALAVATTLHLLYLLRKWVKSSLTLHAEISQFSDATSCKKRPANCFDWSEETALSLNPPPPSFLKPMLSFRLTRRWSEHMGAVDFGIMDRSLINLRLPMRMGSIPLRVASFEGRQVQYLPPRLLKWGFFTRTSKPFPSFLSHINTVAFDVLLWILPFSSLALKSPRVIVHFDFFCIAASSPS